MLEPTVVTRSSSQTRDQAATAELVIFRDYLWSGAIDSAADPDSNMTENWPAEVQAAIVSTQNFAAEIC